MPITSPPLVVQAEVNDQDRSTSPVVFDHCVILLSGSTSLVFKAIYGVTAAGDLGKSSL